MKLKHDIDYQEDEVDGVVYRIARTRSDINAAKDLYIDVLLAGNLRAKDAIARRTWSSGFLNKYGIYKFWSIIGQNTPKKRIDKRIFSLVYPDSC